jgi:hypothetical protein
MKYPDARYWIDLIDPIDATFLMLYSAYRKRVQKTDIIDEESISSEEYFEPNDEEYASNDGSMSIGYPIFEVQIDGNFTCSFTKFYPATRDEPAEGGDALIEDVTIERIAYLVNDDEEEIDTWNHHIEARSYTYKNLYALAEAVFQEKINAEPNYTIQNIPSKIPDELDKIITDSIKNNATKIKSRKINKTFGL